MKKVINEVGYYTHLLTSLGKLQRLGEIGLCPRCGCQPLHPNIPLNSLSRHVDVYICPSCGMEEAMRAAAREEPLPFSKWALFCKPKENPRPARDTFVNAAPGIRGSKFTKRLYALGLALDQECPENDCRIYKNVFNMARELDGAIDIVGGYPEMVLRSKLHEEIRRLKLLWERNYAIRAYRAQSGEEVKPPAPVPWYPVIKEKSGYAAEAFTGQARAEAMDKEVRELLNTLAAPVGPLPQKQQPDGTSD